MSDKNQNPVGGDNKPKDANASTNASNSGKNEDESTEIAKTGDAATASASKSDKKKNPIHGKTANQSKISTFSWLAGIALLLVLGLGAGNYWQYQQAQQLKQFIEQLSQRQSDMDKQVNTVNTQVTEIKNQQNSIGKKTQQTEEGQRSVISSLDQMSQQLKSLSTAKGKEPLFWRVSEVEYLLSVANRRLVLERDVLTTKVALVDADKRLRVIGDPGLIPVREKISLEINALNNVQLPDIPGMAAQLSSVIDGIRKLPFVKKELSLEPESIAKSDKEFNGVGSLAKTVWADLANGLFKVQRSDQPIEPLLPPEEKHYLVHNLGLKLEQARISLLKNDTALFSKNLADVERWVQNYFDLEDAAVNNLLQTVQALKQVELHPKLPDISASLRELRSWIEIQQQNIAGHYSPSPQERVARANNETTP